MRESTRSSPTDGPNAAAAWVVILAGGVGSRFWPVSTPARPKQLLPLAGDRPLLAQTVERVRPLVPLERIRILAGRHLEQPILERTPGLTRENLWLEPRARGTAPVLAWAAHQMLRTDASAVMVSLHADHVIEPEDRFRELLADVAQLSARTQRLFTLGVVPIRPDTGYGYIRQGPPLDAPAGVEAFEVARFVEKPDRTTAGSYVASGEYLWNSGIFIWPAALFLDQLRLHTPELAPLLPLLDEDRVDEFFDRAPELTVDVGLLERSDRVAVARATFAWDDVGAWDAVARTRPADRDGNVLQGDACVVDSTGCIAWGDDGAVVIFGGEDLVVVRANGVTLVAPRDRTADLKRLLQALPERLRTPGRDG